MRYSSLVCSIHTAIASLNNSTTSIPQSSRLEEGSECVHDLKPGTKDVAANETCGNCHATTTIADMIVQTF
ncbi:uncharacterized protein LY89DRAFT_679394 [Mollisia scopiformis]|uniref:Uncharacterized protein n=1 Tax=Mollisia scopiformis TaxID=149040 RepID=A0A194XWS6_MOLSC|nr:uncharacterized protein LY89DRAFT_679394 [Mollisia scopiformis]KUJ24192.1 hypothetical protein LY89DRAFT_679394 [Mollisia scopiformis]